MASEMASGISAMVCLLHIVYAVGRLLYMVFAEDGVGLYMEGFLLSTEIFLAGR
jgi:hypothetical protein